jgi:hypothetical protein
MVDGDKHTLVIKVCFLNYILLISTPNTNKTKKYNNNKTNKIMKKHYKITIIDSLTSQTISFHVYGILSENRIINEYDTPLYIKTMNTISILEIQ